jgi:hypothetical protein
MVKKNLNLGKWVYSGQFQSVLLLAFVVESLQWFTYRNAWTCIEEVVGY